MERILIAIGMKTAEYGWDACGAKCHLGVSKKNADRGINLSN